MSLGSAGIIAAGAGSRLRPAGPLKPLVKVGGKPLAHWVAEGLLKAGARRLAVLVNSSGDPVKRYLRSAFARVSWTFITEDTASSWESFRIVAGRLAAESETALISTVDALVQPGDVTRFAREAQGCDAALGLTRFVDDEKPLWVDVGAGAKVTALGPEARSRNAVTCGLYALARPVAAALPPAAAHPRLRDFWIDLVKRGREVRGVMLRDAVDVDRPEDLAAAERVTACFDA